MNETDITDNKHVARLLEKIVEKEKLWRAAKRVIRNKGVGGIHGMQVSKRKEYLAENRDSLSQAILDGTYPKTTKGRDTKKPGKVRKFGIPTVIDRMNKHAICQVLTPIYEEEFSENSYGFSPGRSA